MNPRSIRDTQSGRFFADRDYCWQGIHPPILLRAPVITYNEYGDCSIEFNAKSGSLQIELTFTGYAKEPDLITEVLTIHNLGNKAYNIPCYHFGFSKQIYDGNFWEKDIKDSRLCNIPYRRHPETGSLCDHRLQDLVTKKNYFSTVRSPFFNKMETSIWGAEGWAWYTDNEVLLISKYNQVEIEWSLVQIEQEQSRKGMGLILRFGGAGRWKLGDPEGLSDLAPSCSFSFGETRYQILDGDWKTAYASYRHNSENIGHHIPPQYNPPVHWNELYDNKLWWVGDSEKNRSLYYRRIDMEDEAEKARELGCQCLYLDPGWDTAFGSNIWDEERLGSQKDFVKLLQEKYGMQLALHTPLAPWSEPSSYPEEARRMDKEGKKLDEICCSSSVYMNTKVARLNKICNDGAYFLMFDGSWFSGECWDTTHGHSIPLTHRDHLAAILSITQRVHSEYPDVLIEQHDPMTGPGTPRYTPTYYMHGKPGGFDELWGFEYMIDPMDDILSRRAFSLYYFNLAYSIPIYLHIDLRKDNENSMMFWWYASTCRHLGIGGVSPDYTVWNAHKNAMKLYLSNKSFFTQGVFHGIDETIHIHSLPGINQCVINCFNLEPDIATREIQFFLSDIGLTGEIVTIKKAIFVQTGDKVVIDLTVPARGHCLIKVFVSGTKAGSIPDNQFPDFFRQGL